MKHVWKTGESLELQQGGKDSQICVFSRYRQRRKEAARYYRQPSDFLLMAGVRWMSERVLLNNRASRRSRLVDATKCYKEFAVVD